MDPTARRFARHVVAFHLLLLVLVVATVLLAWRAIRATARDTAVLQAQRRQEVLTKQTVRAIEGYYASILSDMGLLRQASDAASTEETLLLSPILWNQLTGRVTHLMVLDRATLQVQLAHRADGAPAPEEIVAEARDWLANIPGPTISPYEPIAGGANLLALPVGRGDTRLLVAVVPLQPVRSLYLGDLDQASQMSATLIDQGGRIMSSPAQDLIGQPLLREGHDARMRDAIVNQIQADSAGVHVLEDPLDLGEDRLQAAILTIQPIDVMGTRWWIVLSSSLQEVEAIVEAFFDQAIFWGAFVVVAVSAILVSTSLQLIWGRIRMERLQHEMLQQELGQARQIQMAWLPQSQGDLGVCQIAAMNHPASHISGDFYNWFKLPDGRMVVVIGDVTGHGMAAAFLMATTQLLVRTTMEHNPDPGACLTEVNRQLTRQVYRGQFVTMMVLLIDPERRTVELAAAGHPPPLFSQNGHFEPLAVPAQLVLAVDEGVTYPTEEFSLPEGTCLLLYTDGVTDVQAASGERFSDEGLQRSLNGEFDSAQALLNAAMDAVNRFRGLNEPNDDLTFVAIRLTYRSTTTPRGAGRRMVTQP